MRVAILGASRGLGADLVKIIQESHPSSILMLSARNEKLLAELARTQDLLFLADYAKSIDQEKLLVALQDFAPHTIFYVAGGGPYGAYESKKWKDHAWAFEVNLLFPAKLLHRVLEVPHAFACVQQMVFVGSAIAGQNADPFASSYAASKHGLRGLVLSVKKEMPSRRLLLFEPGYMDTKMLPPNAWPRQQGIVKSSIIEAQRLWQWSQSSVE